MRALRSSPTARLAARLHSATLARTGRGDDGMTTAEYAVGTVAACGFGGVLYKVITSDPVMEVLRQVVVRAFKLQF